MNADSNQTIQIEIKRRQALLQMCGHLPGPLQEELQPVCNHINQELNDYKNTKIPFSEESNLAVDSFYKHVDCILKQASSKGDLSRRSFLQLTGLAAAAGFVELLAPIKSEAGGLHAFGFFKQGGYGATQTYSDDVFSTYVYTGTDATQSISNGIDLAGKGGLVWIKCRTNNPEHMLFDTTRGINNYLETDGTQAQNARVGVLTDALTAFNSNGFTLGANGSWINLNTGGYKFASWTFRKAAKFFDIVTYTGTGANKTVPHNLGSAPGMVIIKRLDAVSNWNTWHRGLTNNTYYVRVDSTSTQSNTGGAAYWNSTTPDATNFYLGTETNVNTSGGTYVAYLFAHDSSSTGLIQCGTFTADGTNSAAVNLGWEPQYILTKSINVTGDWTIQDYIRGLDGGGSPSNGKYSSANLPAAETSGGYSTINATGFTYYGASTNSYIYVAVRRSNKPPTSGTQVFALAANTGASITAGFPLDFEITLSRGANIGILGDRLRGPSTSSCPQSAAAEGGYGSYASNTDSNVSFTPAPALGTTSIITWAFRRAVNFFDVVCYTGVGTSTTIPHGLGVAPELILVKGRSTGTDWSVWHSALPATNVLVLNTNAAKATDATQWNSTAPTASVFSIGTAPQTNSGSYTFVAYLFATKSGVSKVGSYTGNGGTQTINCSFTGGARFIMIKRTDSTGDWFTWDTARGIPAGNDPHLSINTTSAEVTTDDSVDSDSTGFIINQVAATNINVNAATYIFLAIA